MEGNHEAHSMLVQAVPSQDEGSALSVVVNNLERVGCGDAHWVREGVDFWFYEQIAKSCLSSYYI